MLEIESLASWIWGKCIVPEPKLQLLPLILFSEAGKRSRQGCPNHPVSTSLLSLLRLDTWTKIMYWRKGLFGFTVLKNMAHQHARRSTRWHATQQHNLESRKMSNGAQLCLLPFSFLFIPEPRPSPTGWCYPYSSWFFTLQLTIPGNPFTDVPRGIQIQPRLATSLI